MKGTFINGKHTRINGKHARINGKHARINGKQARCRVRTSMRRSESGMLIGMSEISERYRRLSDKFAARIAAVPPDRWGSPSPCEEWTALDVVRHVVETQGMFLGLVNRKMGPIPDVTEDPAGAWDAARATIQADLDDPERAAAEYEGRFGRSTFEQAIDGFINTDLVVHGWDLARATGQDERIDPADLQRVLARSAALGDAMRGPKTFGPPIEAPADADDQTRLLAFLGRRA
jgi:uncharacterized protein (TIGR03086 family)